MGNADPLLTALKSFGYNVVRLPRTDVRPLQILTKNGNNLERLGELTTLFNVGSNIPLPPVTKDTIASGISGKRSGKLNIGVGLNLMGNIIGAMGGSSAGLETQYQQAKTASFEFQNVLEDSIEIAKLDQFLTDAKLNPFSTYVRELLETDNIYITTSTIKSKKFILEAERSDGQSVKVDVPVVQQVVGGSVKVGVELSSSSKVSFDGPVPLVFGFQAIRIIYNAGQYSAFDPAQKVALKGLDEEEEIIQQNPSYLTTDSPFVNLETKEG